MQRDSATDGEKVYEQAPHFAVALCDDADDEVVGGRDVSAVQKGTRERKGVLNAQVREDDGWR